MTDDTRQDTIRKLDGLLDEERAALLSGDLDDLGDMHERKAALLDVFAQQVSMTDAAELRAMQDKLARNQALLDSALSGIQSVARRLAMVRRVRQSLEFYDEGGAKASVDIGIERSVEKRA